MENQEQTMLQALEAQKKITEIQQKLFQKGIKQPSKIGKVNLTRMIRDWNDLLNKIRDPRFDLKRERVYPFLLDDIRDLPEEDFRDNPYIDLKNGIKFNVMLFKKDFDKGCEDLIKQMEDSPDEKRELTKKIGELNPDDLNRGSMTSVFLSAWTCLKMKDEKLDVGNCEISEDETHYIMTYEGKDVARFKKIKIG